MIRYFAVFGGGLFWFAYFCTRTCICIVLYVWVRHWAGYWTNTIPGLGLTMTICKVRFKSFYAIHLPLGCDMLCIWWGWGWGWGLLGYDVVFSTCRRWLTNGPPYPSVRHRASSHDRHYTFMHGVHVLGQYRDMYDIGDCLSLSFCEDCGGLRRNNTPGTGLCDSFIHSFHVYILYNHKLELEVLPSLPSRLTEYWI